VTGLAMAVQQAGSLFGIPPSRITEQYGRRENTHARAAVAWAARSAGLTYVAICAELGWSAKSTVTAACYKADALRKTDKEFRRISDILAAKIAAGMAA